MSFSGYYQVICKNGHLHKIDWSAYPIFEIEEVIFPENVWKCSYCNELAAWWNLCNTTNGSFCSECNPDHLLWTKSCSYCNNGCIDGHINLEIEKEAAYSTCEHCGITQKIAEATYKIPVDKGWLVK
jgi:hypothetical protein